MDFKTLKSGARVVYAACKEHAACPAHFKATICEPEAEAEDRSIRVRVEQKGKHAALPAKVRGATAAERRLAVQVARDPPLKATAALLRSNPDAPAVKKQTITWARKLSLAETKGSAQNSVSDPCVELDGFGVVRCAHSCCRPKLVRQSVLIMGTATCHGSRA